MKKKNIYKYINKNLYVNNIHKKTNIYIQNEKIRNGKNNYWSWMSCGIHYVIPSLGFELNVDENNKIAGKDREYWR